MPIAWSRYSSALRNTPCITNSSRVPDQFAGRYVNTCSATGPACTCSSALPAGTSGPSGGGDCANAGASNRPVSSRARMGGSAAFVLPVAVLARGDPLDRLLDAARAGVVLLRVGHPLEVLTLGTRRERRKLRARLLAGGQRLGELGMRGDLRLRLRLRARHLRPAGVELGGA